MRWVEVGGSRHGGGFGVVGWRLGAVIMEVCWRDSLGEEVQEGNIEYSGGTPNKNMG